MTGAPEAPLERTVSPRLHHLKHQIGDEEKRKQQKIVYQELRHAAEIASFGQVEAHAPQSTHFSGSIV